MATNLPAQLAAPARPRSPDAGEGSGADAVLRMHGVSVDYGDHRVLHRLDLAVGSGELIALLGPSGSGKTTAIRAVAGFQQPSEGEILLRGQDLTRVPVHRRNIGMVFQSYALFPHLSVQDNIAYPMKVKKMGRARIRQRCDELVELVQLIGHAHKRPSGLSGGQQQRVALARALAMDPELLLLDEPLSNLDANLRREVGEEIRRLQQRTGTTAIMVTHDRQEAFGMADRIAVLQDGRIAQFDTPQAVYRRPVSRFMAEFVGEANLLPGTVVGPTGTGSDGRSVVRTDVGELRVTGAPRPGANITVLVRPEGLLVLPSDDRPPADAHVLDAVVRESFYYGSSVVARVEVRGTRMEVVASGAASEVLTAGAPVRLAVRPQDCVALPDDVAAPDAATGSNTDTSSGEAGS
jgi:putative spermidine/putrescine transport system ATP-binding protein